MGVGQLSESDAVDDLRLPFYSSSHPTGSHGWRNQFDLGNPELNCSMMGIFCTFRAVLSLFQSSTSTMAVPASSQTSQKLNIRRSALVSIKAVFFWASFILIYLIGREICLNFLNQRIGDGWTYSFSNC